MMMRRNRCGGIHVVLNERTFRSQHSNWWNMPAIIVILNIVVAIVDLRNIRIVESATCSCCSIVESTTR